MKRQVSGPTLKLLGSAGVSPDTVDRCLDDMMSKGASAVLRNHHPIVRAIQEAASVNVVQISRKSRCLLIHIEEYNQNGPMWQYREHTPRKFVFSCRGELPATISNALDGELLERLVKPVVSMDGTSITNVVETADGWIDLAVLPPLHLF